MINAVHAIVFAPDADKARAFFRDVLELEAADAGGGWLIFALPPAELACHPADGGEARHELYLMCDDVEATLEELRGKGVEAAGEITDEGWGVLAQIEVPGLGRLALYQPRHASPLPGVGG
jgi:catechol 2,3-dioxygenase-like lactoylglutathione lyase family enzyme